MDDALSSLKKGHRHNPAYLPSIAHPSIDRFELVGVNARVQNTTPSVLPAALFHMLVQALHYYRIDHHHISIKHHHYYRSTKSNTLCKQSPHLSETVFFIHKNLNKTDHLCLKDTTELPLNFKFFRAL